MADVLLSIIIVSYNNLKIIDDAIDSIIINNDLGEGLEIIIVEQSTEDYIFNYLKEKYHNISIFRNTNNGFGAGNNFGYKYAKGKYLLFLNPDTKLIEPIGKFAVRKFENNKDVGMFGVKLIDQSGYSNHSFDSIIPYGFKRKIVTKISRYFDFFINDIMYTSGADIFIRRDCFEAIGKFDENIFLYYEESDLCLRMRYSGYKRRYYNEMKIIHLRGKCNDTNLLTTYTREIDSFVYFCKKHSLNFKLYLREEARLIKIKKTLSLSVFNGFNGSKNKNKLFNEKLSVLNKYIR